MKILLATLAIAIPTIAIAEEIALPGKGLILDLDASKGLELQEGDRVASWRNQAPDAPDLVFVKQEEGRAPGLPVIS